MSQRRSFVTLTLNTEKAKSLNNLINFAKKH